MEDLNDKVLGGNLPAPEWNQVPSEIQNVIEQTGQALTNADLNQLGKGISEYVANGNFYTDSGIADAYVLTGIGSKQSIQSYVDGMAVGFLPANTNTGSSTVNVAGLGVKDIVNTSTAGTILSGVFVTLRFRSGSDDFEISNIDTHVPIEDAGSQVVADPNAINFIGQSVNVVNNASTADVDILAISAGGNSIAPHESLICSRPTVSTVDINAAAILVRNTSGQAGKIRLTSINLTIDITVSGENGLDTGSEASSTWYHYYAIFNRTTSTLSGLFSISSTAPTLPAGFEFFALLGAVRNEGDSDFRDMIQVGNLVTVLNFPLLTNGSSTTSPPVSFSLDPVVPPTAIKIVVSLHIDDDAANTDSEGILFSISDVNFIAARAKNNDGASATDDMRISTTAQIHVPSTLFYRVVSASNNLTIIGLGWEF